MMNSGSGVFEDRHSPLSASEPISSGSTSPHVIRPPTVLTNINSLPTNSHPTNHHHHTGHHHHNSHNNHNNVHNRQRSSSINSNGSNHSNHTRSLSIASLESPRNSIVSIDDGFLKSSTRNNSTTSLTSITGVNGGNNNIMNMSTINTPKHKEKERFLLNSKLKNNILNSTVLFSDEDSESDHKLIKPKLKLRSTSSSCKPDKLILKKDFRIKFHDHLKKSSNNLSPSIPITNSPTTMATPILSSPTVQSPTNLSHPTSLDVPSPLILNIDENITKDVIEQNRQANKQSTTDIHKDINQDRIISTIDGSKLQTKEPPRDAKRKSSIKNNYSLKKNFLFSKDIRLELMNGKEDFKSKFIKSIKSKDEDKDKDILIEDKNHPLKPDEIAMGDSQQINNREKSQKEKKLPILSALQQQHHLITQLNRKWSKTKNYLEGDKSRLKRRYSSSSEEEF